MLTATLLGLPALVWFLLFFGAGWLVLGAFFGFLFGRLIEAGEAPFEPVAFDPLPAEPESPSDLDDWLAGMALDFDFNVVWKRPVASTSMRKAA